MDGCFSGTYVSCSSTGLRMDSCLGCLRDSQDFPFVVLKIFRKYSRMQRCYALPCVCSTFLKYFNFRPFKEVLVGTKYYLPCLFIAPKPSRLGVFYSTGGVLHMKYLAFWSLNVNQFILKCNMGSGGFTHRPNRPWPRAPRNSFL